MPPQLSKLRRIGLKPKKSLSKKQGNHYQCCVYYTSSFHPKIVSKFEIWGSESIDGANLLFINDGKLSGFTTEMLTNDQLHLQLDEAAIDFHLKFGLEILSDLLIKDNKSQFEKVSLEAFFIYSRCTTVKDPADKLVYILVALESLFLKNNTEPIQQNLAERIAFLIEKTVEGRMKIIKEVKNAYEIRSSFVHHGASIEDYEALEHLYVTLGEP